MQCFWPSNMVCIVASTELNFGLIWPEYILPVFHRRQQSTVSMLQKAVWWLCIQATAVTYFLLNICTDWFQVFQQLSTSSPWLLDSSDNSFQPSVWNLAGSTWLWQAYSEIIFFPLPGYGLNSVHWNFQWFRNSSVTKAISMFCNNNFAPHMGLNQLIFICTKR